MGNIKDIIDLAKDLESRAKERKDIDTLKQIHSLAHEMQSKQLEIMERDIRLMEENAELKAQLKKTNSEIPVIHKSVEFIKGERTNGVWVACCPKCHLPIDTNRQFIECSDEKCNWTTHCGTDEIPTYIRELQDLNQSSETTD